MKPWGDEPEERPTIATRIERWIFGALIGTSTLVVLASLFHAV